MNEMMKTYLGARQEHTNKMDKIKRELSLLSARVEPLMKRWKKDMQKITKDFHTTILFACCPRDLHMRALYKVKESYGYDIDWDREYNTFCFICSYQDIYFVVEYSKNNRIRIYADIGYYSGDVNDCWRRRFSLDNLKGAVDERDIMFVLSCADIIADPKIWEEIRNKVITAMKTYLYVVGSNIDY